MSDDLKPCESHSEKAAFSVMATLERMGYWKGTTKDRSDCERLVAVTLNQFMSGMRKMPTPTFGNPPQENKMKTADPDAVPEKVFQTWERVTQTPWPGGSHAVVRLLLTLFHIYEKPASAHANMRLQECLLRSQGE